MQDEMVVKERNVLGMRQDGVDKRGGHKLVVVDDCPRWVVESHSRPTTLKQPKAHHFTLEG